MLVQHTVYDVLSACAPSEGRWAAAKPAQSRRATGLAGASVYVRENVSLTSLDGLNDPGALDVRDYTSLTNIDAAFSIASPDVSFVRLNDNDALAQCRVAELATTYLAGLGWQGTVNGSGNDTAATCQ